MSSPVTGFHKEVNAMMSMYSGASFTATEKYSQVSALVPASPFRKWDREDKREKEREKKGKKRSEFDKLLEVETTAYPKELGFYFEARA